MDKYNGSPTSVIHVCFALSIASSYTLACFAGSLPAANIASASSYLSYALYGSKISCNFFELVAKFEINFL